ncbi:hypothetical protein IAI18_00300 [Acetobacteraceae bacterium H6797]|nr:hypothetical protein [Acetobacteraceae bacterium H6797]
MTVRALTLTALVLAAAPALAQQRPMAVTPTRDVAVSYAAQDGRSAQMFWQAATQKMRIETQELPGTVLVDTPTNQAVMLIPQQRIAMNIAISSLPNGEMANPQALANQITGRGGTATIAGLRCTDWNFRHEARGKVTTGTACLTDDGVTLRVISTSGGKPFRAEATRVTYGPQDPARFQVPAGYHGMNTAGLGQGLGQALGGLFGNRR